MMRAVFARASSQQRELPSVAAASVRCYFAPQSVSFTEEVSIAKPSIRGDGPSILDSWKAKADETAHLLQLLQTYKDLGDSKNEPYLKYHNPRTFEDLSKPVPNFRALSLKAGEVPRFFDGVLQGRASDAVAQKQAWWAERKQEAESAVQGKEGKASSLPAVPLPAWSYGSAVSMSSLQSVTDKYIKALEPKRKLHLAPLPAQVKDSLTAFASSLKQERAAGDVADLVLRAMAEKAVITEGGKPLEGFQYVSKAVAAKVLAARRAQVHERYVKYWAKKVLVQPELAAVPLREVDAQLASKFENVAPAYSEVLAAAGCGPKTLAQRVAASPAFTKFFLKRETEADVIAELPPSEAEVQGAALAAKYENDPAAALKALLGPEADAPLGAGAGPLSAQVRAITEHRYTPDRYMYKEGMALAARLEKEEAAARAAGQPDPLNPPTPIQQVIERMKRGAPSPQSADAADSPYAAYVAKKLHEFHSDPSNIAMDELLLPQEVSELLDIELAELAEADAAISDAEEEELWALTLAAQLKHLQKHFGVDLPHGVIAHMDPILVKKIDWETSNNLEDWDITLEDMGADYAKEQWGMESLSHHLLPLIRYRRARAKSHGARFDPQLASPVRG